MRLFLSYGHPEIDIVRMIVNALRERGHDVWFDASEIKAGQLWREKIAEGVRSSNGVVACLSLHSVRNPGVCLDELSIALGVHGGNVKTVLLGPEDEVEPPPSVSHVQWVDMHDWKERLAGDRDSFQTWFDARMGELVEAVESRDSRNFVRDMNGIRDALVPLVDDSRQRELLARGLVGRKWLTELVAGWLEDRHSPRVCLLTGSPGVGKSAFAAHFAHFGIHMRSSVVAALFCEAGRPLYNDSRQVIRTLAYLVACRVPEYRGELASVLRNQGSIQEMNADELFSLLLADPLSRTVDGGRECMCIVIDGMDEVGGACGNALAEVIGRYAGRLPEWVKILAVGRPVDAVVAPIAPGARVIDIDQSPKLARQDVSDYLRESLTPTFAGDPSLERAIDDMTEASQGVMLYARVMADALVKGTASFEDVCSDMPTGLSGTFFQWFRWTFPDEAEYARDFRGALGCLLAAPGGALPEAELRHIFSWDRDRLRDFVRRLEVFLRTNVTALGGDELSLSHAFLIEWLGSQTAGVYRASVQDGVERLSDAILARFSSEGAESLTGYEAAHCLSLLRQAGMLAAYDKARSDSALVERVGEVVMSLERRGFLSKAEAVASETLVHLREAPGLRQTDLEGAISLEAVLLRDLGRHSEAEPLMREALSICRELAKQDPDTYEGNLVLACNNLAVLLRDAGRLSEAESLMREALDIRKNLDDSRGDTRTWETASASSNLASLLLDLGRYTEAEPLMREALSIVRQLAEGEPDVHARSVAIACNAVAVLLRDTGRFTEAEPLMREALATYRRLAEDEGEPGARRWDVATACKNLATLLRVAGRYTEAEPLMREALSIFRQLAESEHEAYQGDVALACNELAVLLLDAGRHTEAEPLMREALENRRKLSGSEPGVHLPEVATACNNLAILLRDLGRFSEAEPLMREALSTFQQLESAEPGTHKKDVALACANLAVLLRATGRSPEAEPLMREALSTFRQLEAAEPGIFKSDMAIACSELAAILRATGRLPEAEPLMREALSTFRQLERSEPGAYLHELAVACSRLAESLRDAGRHSQAEPLMREALSAYRRLAESEPGTYLKNVALACNDLAELLYSSGKLAESELLLREALSAYRKLAESEPGAYMRALILVYNNLRTLLTSAGRPEEIDLI